MTPFLIHPSVPIVLFVAALMVGMVGLCIGTPGGGRIKTSLMWTCIIWSTMLTTVCVISTFEQNEVTIPKAILIPFVLLFQIYIVVVTDFYYAIAEQKKGTHFKVVLAFAGISMILHTVFEYFYSGLKAEDESFQSSVKSSKTVQYIVRYDSFWFQRMTK